MVNQSRQRALNSFLICFGVTGIALTFLFQDFSFLNHWLLSEHTEFIVRKALRVLLNDVFMLLIIAMLFRDKKITELAIFIQLLDGIILLPIYLLLKLHFEGSSEISSPLLSQLHRLIINPTLMILLIPAVYFQKYSAQEN